MYRGGTFAIAPRFAEEPAGIKRRDVADIKRPYIVQETLIALLNMCWRCFWLDV